MKPNAILFFLFLTGFALPYTATAQHEQQAPPQKAVLTEMNVDMPDETVETDLVEPGQLQAEAAFLYNRFRQASHARIGQLLLRYGVSKRLELRALAEDGCQRDRYMEETVQSTYPLAIGAKLVLLKDHGPLLPDLTLVATLKLPFTSRSGEQAAYWSPIFLLAFQNKLGENWKLEYNAGLQQEAYSTDWLWLANASLHRKIAKPLEVFAEYYAQYAPGEAPQHNLGGGLAWQLSNHTEVYVSGGSTIDYAEHNHFFSGGIAFRLP